jgi:N-acetylglucosamine kinase-like BadF-type ATPase
MNLIAESGSTKCDWVLVDNAGKYIDSYKSIGFNPFFHNRDFIVSELRKDKSLMHISPRIERVFFYGAGCSNDGYQQVVELALRDIFIHADVKVDHDLVAAAYSTYTGEPCISCIIGTGSNSCYFDGKTICEEVPALAYILGDEGSGSYFGKKLLTAFLYKKLPPHIEESLVQEFQLNKDSIFEHVYEKPHANVYLASFTRFIGKFKHEPFISQMLEQGMDEFLLNHVCCYKNYKNVPVHFVGSVAFHFEEALRSAAEKRGISIGNIIKQPIQQLVNYHVQYIFQQANV